MFEKEAEETFRKNYTEYCCGKELLSPYWDLWQDGAEFGYNKAFVEADKNLKAVVADFNKANEWHNLRKDPNDLPKDRHNVWIVYLNGYYQEERSVASYRHKFWVIGGLKTECEVIAWCELPTFRS